MFVYSLSVHLYVKAWFQAPSAISAPHNDLLLLKDTDSYKDINPTVSGIAMKKFLGHLWYLSEELIALAFFDDEVPNDVKRKIVRLSLQKPAAEHDGMFKICHLHMCYLKSINSIL